MNTLELTLISMAQQQLSAVVRFNEKRESGAVSDDDVDDFLRDSGALSVLLELGHVSASGMSVDAVSAMLEIEAKHSAAVRAANQFTIGKSGYPVADTSQLEGLTLSEKNPSALIANTNVRPLVGR